MELAKGWMRRLGGVRQSARGKRCSARLQRSLTEQLTCTAHQSRSDIPLCWFVRLCVGGREENVGSGKMGVNVVYLFTLLIRYTFVLRSRTFLLGTFSKGCLFSSISFSPHPTPPPFSQRLVCRMLLEVLQLRTLGLYASRILRDDGILKS